MGRRIRVPWEPPSASRLAMTEWMITHGSDMHQGGDVPLHSWKEKRPTRAAIFSLRHSSVRDVDGSAGLRAPIYRCDHNCSNCGINVRVLLRKASGRKLPCPLCSFFCYWGALLLSGSSAVSKPDGRELRLYRRLRSSSSTRSWAKPMYSQFRPRSIFPMTRYSRSSDRKSRAWLSIRTRPPGVAVTRRNFGAPDSAWELVGRSPIAEYRLPRVDSQWSFELAGFASVERSTIAFPWGVLPPALSVAMDPDTPVR